MSMDRYDPNEWTKSFVTENKSFCLEQLRIANNRVIELVQNGDYAPAIAGLDRIINGLITMLNAGGDYRSHICFFSWIEADIILFGMNAPEDKKLETALKLLEDARDFAKSETAKQNISAMISDLRSGKSISTMRQEYGSEFPVAEVDMLRDLNGKLENNTQSSSSSNYTSNSDSSSGCGTGCFGKIIIVAIIIAAIYFVLMYFTPVKMMEQKAPTPAPANIESLLDMETNHLKS